MDEKRIVKISKRLSLVLRHQPERIKIELDEQGWTPLDILLRNFSEHFFPIQMEEIEEVVKKNNKKRFGIEPDKNRIRAHQGHSVEINLEYSPQEPPEFLFHGTAIQFLKAILKEGLKRQKRHHVHLSPDEATAKNVGSRHGKPVILKVKAQDMHRQGKEFFCTENGVWLSEAIPPEFIIFPENVQSLI